MSQFEQWQERFATLKPRERGLIWLASSGLLLWLGCVLVLFPMLDQQQQLQGQLKTNVKQLQQLEQQIDLMQQQLQQDVNAAVREQIAGQAQQQQQLVTQIRQLTGRYVSPEQMTQLLSDVLLKNQQVQLVSMRSQAPKPLQLPGAAPTDIQLYRHGTLLEFRGSYTQLQQLLARLEQLSWQLHWRQLKFKVTEYPLSQLQLELETVSEQADYLRI